MPILRRSVRFLDSFVAQIWLEASLLFVNFYFRLSSRFSRSISFYTLAVGFSFHHLLSTKRI